MLIREKGLQLVHQQTEAVLLITKRNLRNVRLQVGNLQIETKECVNYLRVVLVFEQNYEGE